jgi:hypothetical protein
MGRIDGVIDESFMTGMMNVELVAFGFWAFSLWFSFHGFPAQHIPPQSDFYRLHIYST